MKPNLARRRSFLGDLGLALLLFALISAISFVPLLREWELKVGDSYIRLTPRPSQPSNVVIVLIDDQSLRQYGRWPWSRTRLAELTRNLTDAGAAVIGLDILLAERQSPEADRSLRDSFTSSGHVVVVDKIGTFLDGHHWVEPLPEFAQNAVVGHAQAVLDFDGVCRRFPARELAPDGSRWAFAVEVARQIAPGKTESYLASYSVPARDEAKVVITAKPVLVPIAFRRQTFDTIAAGDVLQMRALNAVRGRPVLVGFGPTEIGDRVITPLSGELPTPGVEVSAQIVDSIVTGRRLFDGPWWMVAVLLSATCVAVIVVSRRWRGWGTVAVLTGIAALVYIAGLATFLLGSRILSAGPALLAVLVGPIVAYTADWVLVERSINQQLHELRDWIEAGPATTRTERADLFRRLELLRLMQADLGSAFELHRTLLESTDNLVAIFDEKGEPVLRNQRFMRTFGDDPAPLPKIRAQLFPPGSPALSGPSAEVETEVKGELYAVHITPLPPTTIIPAGGAVLTLASLRARVERDRARAEALAFVTHELRTPLIAIQGFAELMMSRPATSTNAAASATIYNESRRLLEMINSYLDVLRLDSGVRPLRNEPVELGEVAQRICELLKPMAAAAQMRLIVDTHGAAAVTGDAALLSGAVLNIVSNAIKYAPPKSEIRVRCGRRDDDAIISVRNPGPLPAPLAAEIFQPYVRGSGAETQPGWGLGLAFVQRIVERHHGTVSASGEAGETVFEIKIPAFVGAMRASKSS